MGSNLIPLLVGGAVVVGLVIFVALPAFAKIFPSITITPNPITLEYTGNVAMFARGFQPGEELIGKVSLPDGTIIPTDSAEPTFADANGSWTAPPTPVITMRLLALLIGPVTDWTVTGKTSGASATTRLTVHLGPAPASMPTSMPRIPFFGGGGYSSNAMRVNIA